MLESLNTNNLEYQKLTKDEMSRRGILGRLVGACADIINPTRNGRKYSEKLWENVFEDPIMKERIENGVCYGELGHPADREETDMEKIAVCLAEVPKKGTDGKLRAVFDILNTPNGRILKSLCDYGSTLGISSRGSGDLEVDYDGQESVNPDTYNCEGFDVVLIPAVKDARLEYVTESLDKKRYNKTLRQKLQESIDKETEEHQKIMKESLDNLGIDLKYDDTTANAFKDEFDIASSQEVANIFDKTVETSDGNLIKPDVNEAWTGTDDIVYGMFNSEPEGQEKVYVDTLTDEVKKIYNFSSVTCGNIIDSNDHNKSLDCIKAFDVQLSDDELNNIIDKISNMLSTKFNATNINCWQKYNKPRGERKSDDKYITGLNFYYQIDDITNINDTLTEAKFGGYSYTYGVHAISLDGRDIILAGAKTEEKVVKLAIEQAQKIFENPFMSSNEKYKYIDDMYISNDDTEQLVEPAGFDDYIDGLLSELRSKKDFKESMNLSEKFIITKIGTNTYALAKGNPPIVNDRKKIEANSYEEAKDILINNGYSEDELMIESLDKGSKLTSHNTQSGTFVKDSEGNIVVETPTDDEASEFIKDQKLDEGAYTKDELLDKFGTTDLDIINAGNEETVTLKEDKSLNESSIWSKISQALNEDAELLDEALSPEEKMDLWHEGKRRENIKACGDAKLQKYLKICTDKGYTKEAEIIDNEIQNRGITSATDDTNLFQVKMSDDKSKFYVKLNHIGEQFFKDVASSMGLEVGDLVKDREFIEYMNQDTQWLVIEKFSKYADEIANAVYDRLSKKDESLDINEGQEAGDYDTALVDELQEALKLNRSLDEKIVNLQKQLSASNAQEMKLNEEIDNLKIKIVKLSDKAKTNKALTEKLSKLEKDLKESTKAVQTKKTALRETIDRDAKDRHALKESINSKDNEIAQLKKQLTESEQRLSEEVANVKSLNEQLETSHKDERQLKEKYTRKLEEKNTIIEKYKNIAKTAVDNYINSRATVLGVSANEIKNRLPESYSFKDINDVCEDLREYNINMNSLPFSTGKLNESINVSAKNIDNRTLVHNSDDDISDTDIKLAEKFMR